MTTTTLLIDAPVELPIAPEAPAHAPESGSREPLFREALGMSLRAFRADKGVSLRALAKQARVSSGYISELERGRKEVSSELLASVCHAMAVSVASVILEAASMMALDAAAAELAANMAAGAVEQA